MKGRALNPDLYVKFVCDQPEFDAIEVLSQTSTIDTLKTAVGDEDLVDHEFENSEFGTWAKALTESFPNIAWEVKASHKHRASLVPR